MVARNLPEVNSLEAAVQTVIRQNRSMGYPPNRFASATRSGNIPTDQLVEYLSDLVVTRRAEQWVGESVERLQEVLTIEDYLQYDDLAQRWGFDRQVSEASREAVRYYNKMAHGERWIRKSPH